MKDKISTKFTQFFGSTPCQQSEKEMESGTFTSEAEGFERCIMCGVVTAVPVSMPVDWREDYEIGCGQLCDVCAKKRQKEVERENALITKQILLAIEQGRKERK